MGCKTDCCESIDHDKQLIQVMQDYQEYEIKETEYRKGYPSQQIAIKIQELMNYYTGISECEYLHKQILRVRDNQKHRMKPLQLNQNRVERNDLPDPYYIPQLKGFYIGEWVYNEKFKENIPKGIGRLYMENWILEGFMETVVLVYNKTGEDQSENQFQEIFSEEKKLSMMTTAGLQDFIYYVKKKELNKDSIIVDFDIVINGIGRKFNRKEEFTGNFVNGKLHGKGKYIIHDISCQYEYSGQWHEGLKQGIGIEKSKTFEYEGQFKNDKKNGIGTLIFHLDKKREQTLAEEQQKVMKQLSIEDKQDIEGEIKQKYKRKQTFLKLISSKLQQFQWKNTAFNQENLSPFDQDHVDAQNCIRRVFVQKYSGEFKNNEMQGRGVYQWYNGKKFKGCWKYGRIQGSGQFHWPDGSVYRGQYRNDLKHGKGEMIWCETRRYRGSWAFGIRHGYGELITINGNTLRIKGCLWKQDKQLKVYFEKEIPFEEYGYIDCDSDDSEVPSLVKDVLEDVRHIEISEILV